MADSTPTRREKAIEFTQAISPWVGLLLLPLLLYTLAQASKAVEAVFELRRELFVAEATSLERSTAIASRVARIEGNRFTKADGAALLAVVSELRQDLAVLQSKVSALRIPPPHVVQALDGIKERLDRLERYLHQAFLADPKRTNTPAP